MEIIPVLDIAAGVAVHARAGNRSGYTPVRSVVAPDPPGNPYALLRGFREILGTKSCYVADLDAIQGGAVQRTVLSELAQLEVAVRPAPGGCGSRTRSSGALEVLSCGASEVVVGLETLRSFADLAAIVSEVGNLAGGSSASISGSVVRCSIRACRTRRPSRSPRHGRARGRTPALGTLLVLDIGRVGTGCGVDLGLVEGMRSRFPVDRLLAGGGVLARRDLDRMRSAGCDGALVASAIHRGAITSADVAALAEPSPPAQSPTSA